MKRTVYSLFIAGLLALIVITPVLASYTISPKIIVGQDTGLDAFAGVVKITGNANGSLTFAFMLKGGAGYCMNDAAIHVGLTLDDFPTNSGGAIPGQFDYKYDFDTCISSYTVTIDPPGDKDALYIAIHVNVMTPDGIEETGWVVRCGDLEGAQFPGSNWSAWILFPTEAWY